MKRWGRICHPVISKGWEMHYIMIDKWLPLLPESVQSFDRAMLESKYRYKHHNNNNWSRYSSGNRNKLNLIKNSGEGIINRIDEVVQPQPRKELVWRNPPPFGGKRDFSPPSRRHLESSWNKTPDNIEFKASRPSPVRLPFFGRPALPWFRLLFHVFDHSMFLWRRETIDTTVQLLK